MEIISRKEAKEQGLGRYFTGKPCKYGHVSERHAGSAKCITCRDGYNKRWREENPGYSKNYNKRWREDNKDYLDTSEYKEAAKSRAREWYGSNKERAREYRDRNKCSILERQKEWRADNRDYIREYMNEYHKNRYVSDTKYRTNRLCRGMIHRTLKATKQTKNVGTTQLLGYTNEELLSHIENLFDSGMTWENHGYSWHIDHKYPIAKFVEEGIEDPAVINALDNLIPMWAEHNMEKSDQTLEEYLVVRPDLIEMYGHFVQSDNSTDYYKEAA